MIEGSVTSAIKADAGIDRMHRTNSKHLVGFICESPKLVGKNLFFCIVISSK